MKERERRINLIHYITFYKMEKINFKFKVIGKQWINLRLVKI